MKRENLDMTIKLISNKSDPQKDRNKEGEAERKGEKRERGKRVKGRDIVLVTKTEHVCAHIANQEPSLCSVRLKPLL